jgi:uncharacterized protein YggE
MKYLILFSVFLSSLSFAEAKPSIQVQGNCEIKVVPDRGTITFEASNQAKDQKEAVKKTNDQINKLKDAISALKLPHLELKNSNYTVYPVREYEKERYVDKGFKASLTLEVTTSDIARIGEAMMSASKVGITNVGSLQSFLSLEKSQQEYLKCLDIAADDARNKAKQLAKKLNFKLGEVISLNEVPTNPSPVPYPERSMMKTMALADSAPTQIEAGTQSFSTNLQVTFSIK